MLRYRPKAWKPCAVPRFEPFAAIRYATDDLASVLAPPYDVLSDADVDALEARSLHNVVRIDVPRGGEDRYDRAAKTMRGWLDEELLVVDAQPSFTIYRMRFTDSAGTRRDIAGVLGALEVVDLEAGGVLPHERTTAEASTDRLDLTRATAANLSPVWGLSLSTGLTELLAEPGEALGAVTDAGVEHVVERVTDPQRIAAIRDKLAADDVLIADGHHRYGVSRSYRDEVREATGRTDTPAELTLAFVNELIEEQLSVEAIHRLYTNIDESRPRWRASPIIRAHPHRSAEPSHPLRRWRRKSSWCFSPAKGPGGCRPNPDASTVCAPRWRPVRDSTRRCPIDSDLPTWTRRNAVRSGQRARFGGGADPAGECRRDRTDRPRRTADAAQVNVLHAQAQDRVRDSITD